MEDVVDALLEEEGLGDVVVYEEEVLAVFQVLDVLQRPGVEVVDADHAVAVGQQPIAEMGAQESRSPRDGRVIEELGHYDPIEKDKAKQFVAKLDRCTFWMDNGAIPSETVSSLLKKAGIEHRMLRLPKPGKPKAAPAAAAEGEKKEEAKA